jgi:rhodanese-related sulfurtransferase
MIDQVRPSGLPVWLQSQPRPGLVLDVREPEELEIAALRADGFELLVIPMNDIPARLAELDPARPVAVLCHHGGRSQRVAMYLASNGFETVANVTGGIDAWSLERDSSVPRY